MSETNPGEELMGKRYGGKLSPFSESDEEIYLHLEEDADDLEYEAKRKRITKRNQRAALEEQRLADASKKKTLRKRHVEDI